MCISVDEQEDVTRARKQELPELLQIAIHFRMASSRTGPCCVPSWRSVRRGSLSAAARCAGPDAADAWAPYRRTRAGSRRRACSRARPAASRRPKRPLHSCRTRRRWSRPSPRWFAQQRPAETPRQPRGTVRISASEIMGTFVLPRGSRELRQRCPGIVLELVAQQPDGRPVAARRRHRRADDAPEAAGPCRPQAGQVPLGLYAHRDYAARAGLPASRRGTARSPRHRLRPRRSFGARRRRRQAPDLA